MFARRLVLLAIPALLAASCAKPSQLSPAQLAALARETGKLARDLEAEGQRVSLQIEDIACLPGDVVIMAGRYTCPAGTFRSMLQVSRDAGLTWSDTGLVFPGCSIRNLRTVGPSNVWGIVTSAQDGASSPQHILASADGGWTWTVTPVDFLSVEQPVSWVSHFEFDDARRGVLAVAGCLGGVEIFSTDDGGLTWSRLWLDRGGPATEDVNLAAWREKPDLAPPPWLGRAECCTGADKVRFRDEAEWSVIETRDLGGTGWTVRSRIPSSYRIKDGRLVPADGAGAS
jgi:hypothetical protein